MNNELLISYLESLDRKIEIIDKKVDKLMRSKSQMVGGAWVVSVLVTIAFQMIVMLYK